MMTESSEPRTAERNAAIFRRIIEEGFNQGDLAVLTELVAPDMKEHQPGLKPGLEGIRDTIIGLRRDLPDLTLTIKDLVADGDKVWARLRAHGVHRAGFFGLPYTGKPLEIDVIDICRFEGGRMVEHWGVPDRFSMLEQLGLLPGQHQSSVGGVAR